MMKVNNILYDIINARAYNEPSRILANPSHRSTYLRETIADRYIVVIIFIYIYIGRHILAPDPFTIDSAKWTVGI